MVTRGLHIEAGRAEPIIGPHQLEGVEALWREADTQSQVYNSKDYTEGLDALVEKRKPVFGDFESLKE